LAKSDTLRRAREEIVGHLAIANMKKMTA
jgi:hypothetical protein